MVSNKHQTICRQTLLHVVVISGAAIFPAGNGMVLTITASSEAMKGLDKIDKFPFLKIFLVWIILKVFIEFVTIVLLF